MKGYPAQFCSGYLPRMGRLKGLWHANNLSSLKKAKTMSMKTDAALLYYALPVRGGVLPITPMRNSKSKIFHHETPILGRRYPDPYRVVLQKVMLLDV